MNDTNLPKPTHEPGPSSRTSMYVYFVRFSVILWGFLVLLPVLDLANVSTPITRGMFALEGRAQFVWVSFYVVLIGWIALLSARIICAYGEERFDVSPPPFFKVLDTMTWKAFGMAQIPGVWFLCYTAFVSFHEDSQLPAKDAVIGFIAGTFFAFLAWMLTAFAYNFLRPPDNSPFHSFLLPPLKWRRLQRLLDEARSDDTNPTLPKRVFKWVFKLVARIGPGYRRPNTEDLHSGHALAILLYLLLLFVYVTIGRLTVPLPRSVLLHSHPSITLLWDGFAFVLVALFVVLLGGHIIVPNSARGRKYQYRFVVGAIGVIGGVLFTWLAWGSFPVLATILLLVLSMFWVGSGLAFLLDRSRVPVVTTLIVFLILLNWGIARDYMYKTLPIGAVHLSTPASVIQKNMEKYPGQPMIIVTATGGGIHSSAWTATVLNGLEQAFGSEGFHQHMVLISSVSGGSVASSYWAELYLDRAERGSDGTADGMFPSQVNTAECSSLEAAAWGVLFPDFQHLFLWKDLFLPSLSAYDRGWALQTAFERNRGHTCKWDENTLKFDSRYRLSRLSEAAMSGNAPAFAFNTTFVDTGRSFILANYSVPDFANSVGDSLPGEGAVSPPKVFPAPSFLKFYHHLDLSLSTVARLSATFPYVSPVAVALRPDGTLADEHLADGGYYDNDGMATAMEFLWSAFGDKNSPLDLKPKEGSAVQSNKSLPCVILIEIRNMEEPQEIKTASLKHPKFPILGHLVEQATAPVTTVLGAWDIAQPLRNQKEWRFLTSALQGRVRLKHVVFAYKRQDSRKKDPLSWHLTRSDKETIKSEWCHNYKSSAMKLAEAFRKLSVEGGSSEGSSKPTLSDKH